MNKQLNKLIINNNDKIGSMFNFCTPLHKTTLSFFLRSV